MDIRCALGAIGVRVVRDMVSEGGDLHLRGVAAGVVFGAWTQRVLVSLAPVNIPRLEDIGMNWRVLAITSALSLATGILFGVLPAWQGSKTRPGGSLKSGRNFAGASVMCWRSVLMMGQLAVSVCLP